MPNHKILKRANMSKTWPYCVVTYHRRSISCGLAVKYFIVLCLNVRIKLFEAFGETSYRHLSRLKHHPDTLKFLCIVTLKDHHGIFATSY